MTDWFLENEEEKRTKLFLFLISPIIGFLYSLKSMNTKTAYRVFFLFALCFGMAFSIQSYEWEGYGSTNIDSGRYRMWFEKMANITTDEFVQNVNDYFDFEDGEKDIFFTSASFLVSRFTDNYHFLFLLFAAIFAFFQLKTLKYLTQYELFDSSLFCLILAFFFTWNQIFNINAMRFYTAAWIGVYTVFRIFLDGDKRYFALLLVIPLVHNSFWLFGAIVIVAFLLKELEWFWIGLFIISFFSSTFLADFIFSYSSYLPDVFSTIASGYTNAEGLFKESEFIGTGFIWVPMVFDHMYKIYTNVLVVLLIFQREKLKSGFEKNLYLFIVILMTYINFAMPIPALGRRSIVMAYPIIAYLWMTSYGKEKLSWLIYIMPFVWSWQILTYSKYYATVLSFDFILSPIYLVFKYLLIA